MKSFYNYLIICLLTGNAFGQMVPQAVPGPVSLDQYLTAVARNNLGYIASQLDVAIGEAELRAAEVFNDPGLSLAYSDNQDRLLQMGRGMDAGLTYNLNLGNLRGARVAVARAQKDLKELVINDYFHNLRADAALCYFQALREKLLADVQDSNYQQMKELAQGDSIRFRSGIVAEADARQSGIEARIQKNEMIRAQAEWKIARVRMAQLRGLTGADSSLLPAGTLEFPLRDFDPNELVRLALENRQDLQAAIQSKTLGEKMVRLVRASRAPEIELETGISYSTIANNEIAPSPAHYAFTLGISMPIKTSGMNRGELSAAQLAVKQLEMQYRDAALAITAEVTKAYIDYQATRQQLEEFHAGLLADADKILASRIYSYQRGETGFLDVLTAQRTYQEVRRSFYETHYACLAALIELERAAGIWDLTTGVGE